MKFLCLLTTLLCFLFAPSPSAAQNIEETAWPLEKHCISEPTAPPAGWSFQGTIFTMDNVSYREDIGGLHAIRADVNTPYYVAANGKDFLDAGNLSPDGKWFAVPYGDNKSRNVSSLQFVEVDAIHIYSTDPSHRMISLPWQYIDTDAFGIRWRDNEHFYADQKDLFQRDYETKLVNPFTDDIESIDEPIGNLSPDGTRALYYDFKNDVYQLVDVTPKPPVTLHSYTNPKLDGDIIWLSDSSGFITRSLQIPQLGLYDRQGELTDLISQEKGHWTVLTSDSHYLAFQVDIPQTLQQSIFIADMHEKKVFDLCITAPSTSAFRFAWSPSNGQLAFDLNDEINVFDLENWQVFIVAHHKSHVIAWLQGWEK